MTSFASNCRWVVPAVLAVCAFGSTRASADDPAKALSAADVERVQEMRRAGKSQDAVAWLDQQPATQALGEQAIALRALAKYDLKDTASVANDIARFREYPGADPFVLTLLGHVYSDSGQFQHLPLAKTYFMRAVAAAPESIEAKFGQARMAALAAQNVATTDAVFAFESSKDKLPAGLYVRFAAEVAKTTATALARAGDRGDQTLRLFELARALTPDDPDPIRGAALTLVLQGKADQAQPLLQDLAKRFPEHTDDVFYTNAMIAKLAGKPDEAIDLARQAYTLRADHTSAMELAAGLLFEQGKLEDVRILIEQAKKFGKPSAAMLMLSARYYLKRAENIPTTKVAGADDKEFAADQAKRIDFLKKALTECSTLRGEQSDNVENLELMVKICDTVGPDAKQVSDEVKRRIAYVKSQQAKRAAKG